MNGITGDVDPWTDLFPDDLIPPIIDLVISCWGQFKKPNRTDYEEPITRRFREALRKNKNLKGLPFSIWLESSETDPETGKEIGRIDLMFLSGYKEHVYFAFECKRLRYPKSGKVIPNTGEYVGEDGMMCFVTGKYGKGQSNGGMIGYVMDGKSSEAKKAVKELIDKKSSDLFLEKGTTLTSSSINPTSVYETKHDLKTKLFTLYHLFLPLN